MKFCRFAASLVLPLALFTPAHAKDLVELNQLPEWFAESWAQESNLEKNSNIKIEKFNVDGTIPGEAALSESGEDWWYFTVDIGAESIVECYTFTSFDGPANALYNLTEQSMSQTASNNNMTISNTFNFAIDVGMVGDTPYMQLDTLYIIANDKNKLIGVTKVLGAVALLIK